MILDLKKAHEFLRAMDFKNLFNELGWDLPDNLKSSNTVAQNTSFSICAIAQLANVAIFEITSQDDRLPDAAMRNAIYKETSSLFHKSLLIFIDNNRSQSLWHWVKREGNKEYLHEHLYVKGQPEDLFLCKLGTLVFEIVGIDNQPSDVLDIASRLKAALDIEHVTTRFHKDFNRAREDFLDCIKNVDDEHDRQWYVSVILNRLMFIYFLQRKGFIDNHNQNYLQEKLAVSRSRGENRYYSDFLVLLFSDDFAKTEDAGSDEAKSMLGKVMYSNGGLFWPHTVEKRWPNITISDIAFEKLFTLFSNYSWNLDDIPSGQDDEISPRVLGYIFEKYINQKSFGVSTRPEITTYLCECTIHKLILEKVNVLAHAGVTQGRHFNTIEELLISLDAHLCRILLEILPQISILDPACGSGSFLVSARNTLTAIYGAIIGKIDHLNDNYLRNWISNARRQCKNMKYYIAKKIITENLFGVDIIEEATEIAQLHLFLALVASAQSVNELESLPNIDFNIHPGNSLIGLLHIDEQRLAQLNLLQKPYHEVVAEKNRLVQSYRHTSTSPKDLRILHDDIQTLREAPVANLNELLLDDFKRAGIKFEQAIWDTARKTDGKPIKRTLQIEDIQVLHPFHWTYEFDQVMQRGGFDIIITNPPWEILKSQAKEFFAAHSDLVSKNNMRIEDFKTERNRLLQDVEVRNAWLDYQSRLPYQIAYYRVASQYTNQGTDIINLYKLFTEQCYNLLASGGLCGIVLPSGIYTDIGAKQLRELLFEKTKITGLFCFENHRMILEGVHNRFKFVLLTYEKGTRTQSFPAAFMRHDVMELERFPKQGALELSVDLICRLSPDSLSVMEFKEEIDIQIAQKMLKVPLLKERPKVKWEFTLTNEFHMTNDSYLFESVSHADNWPLYEGRTIHQFTTHYGEPRYWINREQGRKQLIHQEIHRVEEAIDSLAILQGSINSVPTRQERITAFLQNLGCAPLSNADIHIAPDVPRLAFRSVVSNTNTRTMIATILPSGVFTGNTLNYLIPWRFNVEEILHNSSNVGECYELTLPPIILAYLCGVLNSFTLDYILRSKVSTFANMFYIYQLSVPRLEQDDPRCIAIAQRVARLVCIGNEYGELKRKLLGDVNEHVATDLVEREHIQTEIDGLVAHLYGLSLEEFKHVLNTFTLIEMRIKEEALDAYYEFSLEPGNLRLAELIAKGESESVEFKLAACWNAFNGQKDVSLRDNIIEEVAAFLNTDGGTILIGLRDDSTVVGLADDYKAVNASKPGRDSYQLFLQDVLKHGLVSSCTTPYKISFRQIYGKDVCRIDIERAEDAVYLKNHDFYIRDGNRKLKLTTPEEIMKYDRSHWGKS